MIREEIYREQEINGQKFAFKKDTTYSFWSVTSGGYDYPGTYTSYPRAIEAAEEISRRKKTRKVKEVG